MALTQWLSNHDVLENLPYLPAVPPRELLELPKAVHMGIAKPCEQDPLYYCLYYAPVGERQLDLIASYIRRTKDGKSYRVRMWKMMDNTYAVLRGLALKLPSIGFFPLPYAPWIPPGVQPDPVIGRVELRPYQVLVATHALEQMRRIGAATIHVAAGGGKTYIMLALYHTLSKYHNIRAVWLTLSKDLIEQSRAMAKKMGIHMGAIHSEEFDPHEPLTAITVQSAYAALYGKQVKLIDYYAKEKELSKDKYETIKKLITSANLILFDESQHIPAATVARVVRTNRGAIVVSASGTPYRNDYDTPLIYGVSGSIVEFRITSSDLIRMGYLAKPIIVITYTSSGCGKMKRGPRGYVELRRCIETSHERLNTLAKITSSLATAGIVPIMIQVTFIDACKKTAAAIRQAGVSAVCVSSMLSATKRKALFDAVRTGRVQAIVLTPLGREGLDLPNVMVEILASGGKSEVGTPQQIGRALRIAEGKRYVYIIDLADAEIPTHIDRRLTIYSREPEWDIKYARSADEAISIILSHYAKVSQMGG